jgi:hypothetical protein
LVKTRRSTTAIKYGLEEGIDDEKVDVNPERYP